MAARRASAVARQEAYDKLSLEQKLAKLPPEPAGAKVRAKLVKLRDAKKPNAQDGFQKPVPSEEVTNEIKKPKRVSSKKKEK